MADILAALAYAAGSVVGTLQAASPQPAADHPSPRPKLNVEVSPSKRDTYDMGQEWLQVLPNPDVTQARNQAKLSEYQYPYGLYLEAKKKDPHLQAVLSQRVGAVIAAPRTVQPAAETPEAQAVADLVRAVLDKIAGFNADLREMAMACYLGVSYHEALWALDSIELGDGTSREVLRPTKLAHRKERRFAYTPDGEMRLLTPEQITEGVALPPRCILAHRPLSEYENLYGDGLAETAYWYCKFKKDTVFWWQVFNEKWASPTIKATHPRDFSPAEKSELKRVIRSIQQQTGLLVPEGVVMEIFEAQKYGSINSYESFSRYCDEALSKLVLGQTLTTQQGDTGARGMATVHMEVRGDLIRQDAQALCETVDELIHWIVDLNYPEGARHYPHYQIDTDPPVDALANLNKFDVALNKLKLPLSKTQVYEESNLVRPEQPEELDAEGKPVEDDDVLLPPAPPPSLFDPFGGGGGLPPTNEPGAQDAAKTREPGSKAAARMAGARMADTAVSPTGRHSITLCAEGRLPGKGLVQLKDSGVEATAGLMDGLPAFTRDWILAEAARIGLGPDDVIGDPAKLPWNEWAIPAETRSQLVDRLNDDLAIGYLYGRAASIRPAAQATQALVESQSLMLASQDPVDNPLVEALWGEKRIIPRRVLSAFTRKVHASLTWESFYQVDALARSASLTAWDLTEADVRHIGGALQDAIHNGWTCREFATYLHDRLEARYVSQGGSLHAWHVETIYHTNLATAYNHANLDEIYDERDLFPYVQFINPNPQYALCVEMAGKVWRADDPTWRAYCPPQHFNCGSSIASFNDTQLKQSGLSVETAPPVNSPEVYSGPGGQGKPAPFGAWAPSSERYAHLEEQLR